MLELAEKGIQELIKKQQEALGLVSCLHSFKLNKTTHLRMRFFMR